MTAPADDRYPDRWIYDGTTLVGAVKQLAAGDAAVFTAGDDGELIYHSKAPTLREGVAMIHAARLKGATAQDEQRRAS